jgi:hypothetical protein
MTYVKKHIVESDINPNVDVNLQSGVKGINAIISNSLLYLFDDSFPIGEKWQLTGFDTTGVALVDGLISGGAVWDTGLTFNTSIIVFRKGGDLYVIPEDTLTLATADPTNPRIDVIVADIDGTVKVITGTPAASPVKPEINLADQVEITFATVSAGATTPDGVSSTDIYLENAGDPAEWDATESTATARVDLASTNDFFSGAVSIEATLETDDTITLNTPTPIAIGTIDQISFRIKPSTLWANNARLRIGVYNGGSLASDIYTLRHNNNSFDTSINVWNLIVIDASVLNLTGTNVDTIVFEATNDVDFFLDEVTYKEGIVAPPDVVGISDHTLLTNIGINTHDQIDTHIALTNEHLDWTAASVGTIEPTNYVNLYTADGTISASRTITLDGAKTLTVAGTTSTTPLYINHTGGGQFTSALLVQGTLGTGLSSTVTGSRPAVRADNTGSGNAIQALTEGGGIPILAIATDTSVNVEEAISRHERRTSGVAEVGIAAREEIAIHNAIGTSRLGVQRITTLTNVTDTSEQSTYLIKLLNGGLGTNITEIGGEGYFKLFPITGAEAIALTPAEGMQVMVSSTSGLFDKIGYWVYQNGAWVFPNNNIYTANGTISGGDRTVTITGGNKLHFDVGTPTLGEQGILISAIGTNNSQILRINNVAADSSSRTFYINHTGGTGQPILCTAVTNSAYAYQFINTGTGGGMQVQSSASSQSISNISSVKTNISTNTIGTHIILRQMSSGGAGAAGLGAGIQFDGETSTNGSSQDIGQISMFWEDPTISDNYGAFQVELSRAGNPVQYFKVSADQNNANASVRTDTWIIKSDVEGGTASLNLKVEKDNVILAAVASQTTSIGIPEGAMLYGVQFNVDVAVTTSGATNTFSAAFNGGSTTALFPIGTSGALNTKGNKLIAPEVTTALTDITFTADNAETFVAGGEIEVLVYYYDFTSMANA